MFACKDHHGQKVIKWNVDFSVIQKEAEEKQQNFCVILLDTTSLTSKIYEEYLRNSKMSGLFNFIDVWTSESEWYQQWLYTKASPITCIFSSSGILIDIIPGASRRCFKCIKEVMEDGKMCEDLAFYNNFSMSEKEDIIPLLNDIFQLKLNVDEKVDVSSKVQDLSKSIMYPYLAYLGMQNSAHCGNKEKAAFWARRLLSFNGDIELEIYSMLFTEAKAIIDVHYDSKEEPYLICAPIIYLYNCRKGEKKPFSVNCINSGDKPLNMDITLDCSCISLLSDSACTIQPHDSLLIQFEFMADDYKRIEREITIKSNAINPIKKIVIVANDSSLMRKEENMGIE